MKSVVRAKYAIKFVLALSVLAVFVASCMKQAERLQPQITSAEMPDAAPQRVSSKTFKDFSHKIPEHLQFECNICHQREAKGFKSKFGGHESCIGCHMNEWIAKEQMICSICHDNVASTDPPVKAFPVSFKEGFNTEFQHGDHDSGAGRPPQGCAACHSPAGRAQTIQSGFETHATCYECHNAENRELDEKKRDSCNVCHKLADYVRTLPSQYSPKIIFSHRDHTRDDCSACHKVTQQAPQGRQVSHIQTLEHRTTPGNNCLQCHISGGRAFTGNDPKNLNCNKCHKDFVVTLPEGTYADTAEEAPEKN